MNKRNVFERMFFCSVFLFFVLLSIEFVSACNVKYGTYADGCWDSDYGNCCGWMFRGFLFNGNKACAVDGPTTCPWPNTDYQTYSNAETNKCPSSGTNGATCDVKSGWYCTESFSGKWDASENKCVVCSNGQESKIYGDSYGIYTSEGGINGNSKCESACSDVDNTCDEKTPGTFLNSCKYGKEYFVDKCSGSCKLEDEKICRSSYYAPDCTASLECNGVAPGSNIQGGSCDNNCRFVKYLSVSMIIPEPTSTSTTSTSTISTTTSPITTKIYDSEDAYVWDKNPNTNYGSDRILVRNQSISSYKEVANGWVKFDLSSLPSSISITSAIVRLSVYSTSPGSYVYVRFSSTDSWNESGITWNNQPSYGGIIVGGTGNYDVTNLVKQEYNGDKKISLVFTHIVTDQVGLSFDSKEVHNWAYGHQPYLEIIYNSGTMTTSTTSTTTTRTTTSTSTSSTTTTIVTPSTCRNMDTVWAKQLCSNSCIPSSYRYIYCMCDESSYPDPTYCNANKYYCSNSATNSGWPTYDCSVVPTTSTTISTTSTSTSTTSSTSTTRTTTSTTTTISSGGPQVGLILVPIDQVKIGDEFYIGLKYTHSTNEKGGIHLRWKNAAFDIVDKAECTEYYVNPPNTFAGDWEGIECSNINSGTVKYFKLKALKAGAYGIYYRGWDLIQDENCGSWFDVNRDPQNGKCTSNCDSFHLQLPDDWAICNAYDYTINVNDILTTTTTSSTSTSTTSPTSSTSTTTTSTTSTSYTTSTSTTRTTTTSYTTSTSTSTTTTTIFEFIGTNFVCNYVQTNNLWECSLDYINNLGQRVIVKFHFIDLASSEVKSTGTVWANMGTTGTVGSELSCSSYHGTYYVVWRAYQEFDRFNAIKWSISPLTITCS